MEPPENHTQDAEALARRIVELENFIVHLTKHIDAWTHSVHRAYHGGPEGYFKCPINLCAEAAYIIRFCENH